MAQPSAVIDASRWMTPIGVNSLSVEYEIPPCAGLETAYRTRLPLPPHLESNLNAALRHLLDHPGNMVRLRIVYRMATAFGIEPEAALDLGAAIEYFHTASLVFDDLPCMDNAFMRRGAPCTHLLYGESQAVLAALALINRAYALTWKAACRCPQTAQRAALAYLEQRLGVGGLLNGQSLDLNYNALPHTPESTARVARGKTVALIALTLCLPAVLGEASTRELHLLERISTCWGLGYQMVDDLKDVLQTDWASGKTAARDVHLDRPNIALAIGVPKAIERLKRILNAGDRTLEVLLRNRRQLAFLRDFRASMNEELRRILDGARAIPVEGQQ